MNLKKILTGASALTLAAVSVASAASFTDTAGHWVNEYLDTAVEEGVINGGNVAFRPDANITRAEITKIVVNYDNGGENPTADDYASVSTLSDVKSSAWYFHHVNYAVSEGIAKGYADGTFKPEQAVTRAEASKMIAIALEVPSVDVTMPFTDVPSTEWFYPYVKSLYGNCVVKGRTATQFAPAASVTRAEVVKMFVKSLNPGCDATTPTNTAVATSTPTSGVVTLNPSATTNATVDVQLSAKSPAAQTVPVNAYQVPFIALDITASNDEDLMLTGLTVNHSGLGDEAEVQNVQVFEGAIPRGNAKNFAGEDDAAVLNLTSDPVVIPKGTTKTVYVAADLGATTSTGAGATAGGEHLMAVISPANVQLVGKSTGALVKPTGTFPIMGSKMTVANITVGQLDITHDTLADTTLESGLTNQELARIKFDATSTEDVYLRSVTVEMNGSLDDGDVRNLYAEIDGVKVSPVVATTTNDFVTFDLTAVKAEGYLIKSGSAKYVKVRGDLTGPIDNFGSTTSDLAFMVDEVSDVVAIGAKYGFGVKKVRYGSAQYIDIIGGDITFSITSNVTDIAADTDGINFGTLKIENKAEAIEIDKSILFSLVTSNGAKPSDLEKVKLVAKNGVTILGPIDPTTTTASTSSTTVTENLSTFGDDFIIGAGQTVEFDIIADTKKTAVTDGKYYFALNMGTVAVTGQTSDSTTGFTIKPSTGTLSTKTYTIKSAGVLLTAKPLENDTYVAKTQNAVVWYGTVRAANVNDVKVTRLAFQNIGTATTSDIRGYDLQAKINGTWVNVESSVSSTAPNTPFTFTNLNELASKDLVIKKGEELEVRLVADIADTVVNSNTIKIEAITANSLTQKINADNSLGDDLKLTNVTDTDTTNDKPVSGSTYTLATNGSFAVTLDAAKTPDSAIIAAGNTVPAEVGVYKLKATNEDVNVEKLTVLINEKGATAGVTSGAGTANSTLTSVVTTAGRAATANTATVTVNSFGGPVSSADVFTLSNGTTTVATVTCTGATFTQSDVVTAFATGTGGICARGAVTAGYDLTESTGNIIKAKNTTATGTVSLVRSPANGADSFTGSTFASLSAIQEVTTLTVSGTVLAGDVFQFSTTNAGTPIVESVTGQTTTNGVASAIAAALTGNAGVASAIASGNTVVVTASADTDTVTPDNSSLAIQTSDNAADTTPTAGTQAARTSGTSIDVANDANAVKSVALYYTDGTPVLKKNGSPAVITGLVNREAFFEDLNLPVASGIDKYISVRLYTNDIQDGDTKQTAMSGHIISADLMVDGTKGKVVGLESGSQLTATNPALNTEYYVVTNNKIVAALAPVQPTSLYVGAGVELLKVKLSDTAMDSDEAGLAKMTVTVSASAGTITNLEVVNGQGTVVGTVASVTSGTAVDVTIMNGTSTEFINGGSEIYTIRATLAGITADSTVNTQIAVNGASAGTDGITWLDSAAGTVSGVSVKWIDLGEAGAASGITKIENTIRN